MSNNYQHILKQFEKARSRRRQWDSLLNDAYRYALPNHDPRCSHQSGDQRDSEIYDNTAVEAVQIRKAKLHGDLFPAFEDWMEFELKENSHKTHLAQSSEITPDINSYISDIQAKFHDAIAKSNFHVEIDPALADCCISTGALLVHAYRDDNPLLFEAVPIGQIIPEETADGILRNIYREWKMPVKDIIARWGDAHINDDIRRLQDNSPDEEVTIIEAWINTNHDSLYDSPCQYMAFMDDALNHGDHAQPFVTRIYDVCPMIVFRIDKAPGEWMGRGPVLNILGDIKTLNKAVELTLKNATIAVTGIWQADDDGVLNPANIRLVPGAIIPKAVGSSGLTPLQSPARFDISQIIMSDLQEKIRKAIAGSPLPDTKSGIRTALELDLRAGEQQQTEMPISLRLLSELYQPLASRILSILSSPAMAGSPYYMRDLNINNENIKVKPISPLVKYQKRMESAQAFNAYIMAGQNFPDILPQYVDRVGYLQQYLNENGFPTHFIQQQPTAIAAQNMSNDFAENIQPMMEEQIANE